MARKRNLSKATKRPCPVCGSKATVGEVLSRSAGNKYGLEWCYFCSNCLSEFDDRGVRVFNASGQFMFIDPDYRLVKEG